MTDARYNDKRMNKDRVVSDNVLKDLLSFSYPRTPGGPVVGYNNIDVGTRNAKSEPEPEPEPICDTGMAKRHDGSDDREICSRDPLTSVSTLVSTSATTSTATTESHPRIVTIVSPEGLCPACSNYKDCAPCREVPILLAACNPSTHCCECPLF